MIITDPALIALQSTMTHLNLVRPRATRFKFWTKQRPVPNYGSEAYDAHRSNSLTDADFIAAKESGGVRIHAITRNTINAG